MIKEEPTFIGIVYQHEGRNILFKLDKKRLELAKLVFSYDYLKKYSNSYEIEINC